MTDADRNNFTPSFLFDGWNPDPADSIEADDDFAETWRKRSERDERSVVQAQWTSCYADGSKRLARYRQPARGPDPSCHHTTYVVSRVHDRLQGRPKKTPITRRKEMSPVRREWDIGPLIFCGRNEHDSRFAWAHISEISDFGAGIPRRIER